MQKGSEYLPNFINPVITSMTIRNATTDDVEQLRQLYFETIMTINARDYSPEQVTAWASTAERIDSLKQKIKAQHFYVATIDKGTIIGFSALEENGHLDMLYVHKEFQGLGVAKELWKKILAKARMLGITRIETEASITAKPFFEKQGFHLIKEQTVFINETGLTNYKMVFNDGKKI